VVVAMDILNVNPVSTASVPGSTQTSPAVISAVLQTGLAPQGVLLDPVTQRLFSQDFMGRSVTVRDAGPYLSENLTSFPLVTTTQTQASEPLTPNVLLGWSCLGFHGQGRRFATHHGPPRPKRNGAWKCSLVGEL